MAFKHFLGQILMADPTDGPVFLLEVDLSGAYLPCFSFVIVSHPSDFDPLICFHLSMPMGLVESAQFFCCMKETVVDMVQALWEKCHTTAPHPIDALANSNPAADDNAAGKLPDPDMDCELNALFWNIAADEAACLHMYVETYADTFSYLAQGEPPFWAAAWQHIFHIIDRVFWTNNSNDCTWQEPNSLKKLRWDDVAWKMKKRMLG